MNSTLSLSKFISKLGSLKFVLFYNLKCDFSSHLIRSSWLCASQIDARCLLLADELAWFYGLVQQIYLCLILNWAICLIDVVKLHDLWSAIWGAFFEFLAHRELNTAKFSHPCHRLIIFKSSETTALIAPYWHVLATRLYRPQRFVWAVISDHWPVHLQLVHEVRLDTFFAEVVWKNFWVRHEAPTLADVVLERENTLVAVFWHLIWINFAILIFK